MPERPVILFPSPEKANRNTKSRVYRRINNPQFSKQYNRLQPSFQVLQDAFRQKNLVFQQSAAGINPEIDFHDRQIWEDVTETAAMMERK